MDAPHGSKAPCAGGESRTQDYGAILELRMQNAAAVTSIEQT